MKLGFFLTAFLFSVPLFGGPIVNDITRVNPIEVDRVVFPKSTQEVVAEVKNHPGPISIAGGRYSQGGQTALEHSLNIDMTLLDRVIDFQPEQKEITVEAGITWKKIQRYIDPYHLSIKIMQTYSNFTVGGSLSVNVHGRYMGMGPIIGSVKSFKLVLADGRVVRASPTEQAPLFYGAIGGYGSLGVITEVTLSLADNVKVERSDVKMPISKYKAYFYREVRENKKAVFHNADIYPPAFERVRAVTWNQTENEVTEPAHLIEQTSNSFERKLFISVISDWPLGKWFREYVLDPWLYRKRLVYRRNLEASYDVVELEPFSRKQSTYVLQEYFVPVDRFDDFVPKMREVFKQHRVNIFNVSIRHANRDPGSLLAWARQETFAFVVYYKQGFDETSRRYTGVWTRALIDAVLSCDGAYYLPYQIHATDSQFFRAYPRASEFFALKRRWDPHYKFKNKLWERYLSEADLKAGTFSPVPYLKGQADYKLRPEEQTFLTIPEWFIVFSSAEYAHHLTHASPSTFPWFSSIQQFWNIHSEVNRQTRKVYPSNSEYRTMINVIGASFSGEYFLKGLYENTVGRITTWLATDGNGQWVSSADRFMSQMQDEYVAFIRLKPWYQFAFLKYLKPLWHAPTLEGESRLRRWERRLFYSSELITKATYGWLIRKATQSAYQADDSVIDLLVRGNAETFRQLDPQCTVNQVFPGGYFKAQMPRYESFTALLPKLTQKGFTFYEIAGNQKIAATFIAPAGSQALAPFSDSVFRWPILTEPGKERLWISLNTKTLLKAVETGQTEGLELDHVFDY